MIAGPPIPTASGDPLWSRRRVAVFPPLAAHPSLLWLLVGLVIPITTFFLFGFWEAKAFRLVRIWSLDRYAEVVFDPLYRGLIINTLLLAFGVAVIVVVIAYAGAYATRFALRDKRRIVLLLIVASALASYLVRIYAWKAILSPNGVLNWALTSGGIVEEPLNLLGRFGVTVTLVHILLPMALLPIYASMERVNHDVIRAARDLGAGPIQCFLRVTLPLTKRGAAIAFLLTFILAAGDYVTPQLVGGRGSILVGRVIYDQFGITGNFPLASAMSFGLIAAAVIFIGLLHLLLRVIVAGFRLVDVPVTRFLTGTRLPSLPQTIRRVGWGPLFVGLLLAFLYFPLVLVALLSFNDLPIASLPFRDFTLKWYQDILGDEVIRRAFVTSLKIALVVAAISTLVGVPGAFAVARWGFATKPAYLAAALLPISLPGVVLGFSILSAMRFLQWSPSLPAVVLGQVTYAFPFVLLIMVAALQDFDRRLEEAGRDLGCTHRGVLRRVTLPILLPVMAGAAIIVFAISMDEFVITNFLVGSEPTLPPVIWSIMNRRGIPPTINAIATILMIASLIFVLSVTAFMERNARRRYRVHSLL